MKRSLIALSFVATLLCAGAVLSVVKLGDDAQAEGPGPGMSLTASGPAVVCDDDNKPASCDVQVSTTFQLQVQTNDAPAGITSGFSTEILTSGAPGLTYNAQACATESTASNDVVCVKPVGGAGEVQHAVGSSVIPPLSQLDSVIPSGEHDTILQLSFTCSNSPSNNSLTLAGNESPFGGLYFGEAGNQIDLKVNNPADALNINCDTSVQTNTPTGTLTITPTPTQTRTPTPTGTPTPTSTPCVDCPPDMSLAASGVISCVGGAKPTNCTVGAGSNFNLILQTNNGPAGISSGFASEILVVGAPGLTYNSAACATESTASNDVICAKAIGGAGEIQHAVGSGAVPPLPQLDSIIPSGEHDTILSLSFSCHSGSNTLVLTGSESPFGGTYFDGMGNQIFLTTNGPTDSIQINCVNPPTATTAPAQLKNVSANVSATKVLAGGTAGLTGSANFRQDVDGDTVAGWGGATISVTTTAGAVTNLTATASNAACAGNTCTANVNKGPAVPATGPESTSPVNFTATINCSVVGTHNVIVAAAFTREDGSAVPPSKSTNNVVILPLTCNPLTPPIQKLPALQNLFLTNQPGPKIPPNTCASNTDDVILQEVVGSPITSLDPKGLKENMPGHPFYDPDAPPAGPQVLAAFEFEVRFDDKLVCVNLEPGPAWDDATCLILDKDTSQLEGIARMGCFTPKGQAPGNDGLHLANIVIRPTPDVYSLMRPNQENGITVQLLNQDCELADELGHPIAFFSCEDADITIRYLEGDMDANCEVDVVDGQASAFRWNAVLGNLLYREWHDLEPSPNPGGINGDGDIDIKDIQFIFGRIGSTCADPNPDQPPVNPKADP